MCSGTWLWTGNLCVSACQFNLGIFLGSPEIVAMAFLPSQSVASVDSFNVLEGCLGTCCGSWKT